MSVKTEYLVGGVMAAVGVVGMSIGAICSAITSTKKVNETEKRILILEDRLSRKIDGLSDSLDVDIPDDILEVAVRKAAEREAREAIKVTASEIMQEYKVNLRNEVRKSVELAYDNTKVDVKDELSRQVKNLDISGIKQDIIKEASEKAKDKLNSELESIANKFSNDLESSSKILKLVSDKLGTTN